MVLINQQQQALVERFFATPEMRQGALFNPNACTITGKPRPVDADYTVEDPESTVEVEQQDEVPTTAELDQHVEVEAKRMAEAATPKPTKLIKRRR
jgi:hypothetical protein